MSLLEGTLINTLVKQMKLSLQIKL
jgi:hypothetical protein